MCQSHQPSPCTELGRFTQLSLAFRCGLNHFSGSLPTEIGQLAAIKSYFSLSASSLSSSIPTQVGGVRGWGGAGVRGWGGRDSWRHPSLPLFAQLGQLSAIAYEFRLLSNDLCAEVPTEVQVSPAQRTS